MDKIMQKDHESFQEWKERLFEAKYNKEIDITWPEMVELLGLTCHHGSLRKAAARFMGKKFKAEVAVLENMPDSILKEIEEKQRELRKERTKLQDYRREFNKFEKTEAKFEHLLEAMLDNMNNLPKLEQIDKTPFISTEEREGLVLFSDWHYGAIVDNDFNVYNRDIAKQRIEKLVAKIIKYGKHNGITTLSIAQLGDIVSGQIHLTTRLFSDLDVVQQIQEVTEILAEVIAELCKEFPQVVYYNVIGNHGRSVARKEDAAIADNFEYFVCWYLRARLKDFDNLTIIEDRAGIIATEIMGQQIVLAHGNYEKLNTAEGLSQMFGYVINQVYFGHYHHSYQKEIGQHTELIQNSSLIGADEYSLQMRRISKPAQKFIIYNEDGVENIYNILLK